MPEPSSGQPRPESGQSTRPFVAGLPPLDGLMDDLRARLGRGEPARVEQILGQHPGLDRDREAVLDLIYAEVVERERAGEPIRPDEYHARFPHLADALADLFEVHAAFGGDQADGSATRTDPRAASGPAPVPERVTADPSWPVLEGYDILGELGRGGMGVVYRAHDRRRDDHVALKTMQRVDGGSLYRFKQEFRALCDLSHPNLVHLHELVSDGSSWFITMELVDGVDFLRHVREGQGGRAPVVVDPYASTEGDTRVTDHGSGEPSDPMETTSLTTPLPPLPSKLGTDGRSRLRLGLRQLAEGVAALHAAGKLHRDIKPSNVLVSREGRVVLMDFGLATEQDRQGIAASAEGHVVGTVAYMSPEQAEGRALTPASDWYSVGVMLYQALTGRLPFVGGSLQILMDKQRHEPAPPREVVPDVPDDLNSLCVDLLRRDPQARPSGHDVLRRLGGPPGETGSATTQTSSPRSESHLVGREAHREALADAFDAVAAGRTVVLAVRGRSGVGKSALVQSFLDGLVDRADAVVLAGRCYENESVPYKALDSLIDALSRLLHRLSDSEVGAILPRDVGPLARVFPVLRRVEAIANAPRRSADAPDPQELRRRAFAGLRELLERLGDRKPLVLAIDDLQWADADSLAALAEVLRPPDPPVLLLIGCYRSEDAPSGLLADASSNLDQRELAVEPLRLDEARALALSLLGRHGGAVVECRADLIARESGGNPLFVAELARAVQAGGGVPDDDPRTDGGTIALDEVLWSRIVKLPDDARRLLEAVAVSGRPIAPDLAWRSLGLRGDERTALSLLRTGRLLRTTALARGEEVETYHDRVRETIVHHLGETVLQGHHLRLAHAHEASGQGDPEVLAVHYLGAGEEDRAGVHYARAAAAAAEALAFDRAVSLYRTAVELHRGAGADRVEAHRRLRAALADALANAGRGAEAADEYLAAAEGATVAEAFELRRRSAMQALISGHIDRGLATLRTVLEAVGMRLPTTPRQALGSFLLGRARLQLRGLGFRERDPSEVPAAELSRIDVCWSAGAGLSVVDWIRGADFQTRGLRLALRAGEPSRVARALAMEAAHTATAGSHGRRRTSRLLATAETLAARAGQPYALGMVELAKGVSSYLAGDWRGGLDGCDRADAIFRGRCTGVAWEIDTAHSFALWALTHLGELAELGRRLPVLLKEARERGDLYAAMNLNTYSFSVLGLANDRPDASRDEVREIMAQWSREGYHVQHNDQLWAATQIELYRGDGPAAWELLERYWPALARSLLLRVQFVRVAMWTLRARSAIAAVGSGLDTGHLLRSAERDARRLEREGVAWAAAYARLARALIALARGDRSAATAGLADAAERFDGVAMRLCAAATRRRLGELLGGDQGRPLIAEADAWMSSQAIANPARMADMYAPTPRSLVTP